MLSLFPEGFITYIGKRQNVKFKAGKIASNGALFRIQAPYGDSARAIEQPTINCQNLNSGDAFLLVAPGGKKVFLWLGLGANEAEAALGRKLMDKYGA